MEQEYLPGTLRTRVLDLMKEHKVTQSDLALRIGMSESTLSRFLRLNSDKLSSEQVLQIARAFNVSTDFLLGESNIPDRMNYDISELGLSAQAARNLYTGKVHPNVINRLLENQRFATVTNMIAQYFDDMYAGGYAAQNQMYQTLSSLLLGQAKQNPELAEAAKETAKVISYAKVPAYQADLTNIQNQFMAAIKEIKKEVGSDLEYQKLLSKKVTEKMFNELTKGQDILHPTITPEQLADAITGTVANADNINHEKLDALNQALVGFFQMQPEDETHGNDE